MPYDAVMQPQKSGVLFLVLTAFLWSIAGLFIKIIDWNPFAIAGVRSLIAIAVILVWIRRPRFTWSGPQIGAAIANAATMILFVCANKTTTAANAILLQYMAPVFTALLAFLLLKERPRVEHLAATVVTIAGVVVLFMDKIGGGSLLGNLLAFGSSISFAFMFVCMRLQKSESPVESMLLSHILTAVICLIVAAFLPLPHLSPQSLAAILVLGVAQIGLPAILFSAGIKHVPALSANLIAVIEPVFNPLWVFLAIGERPGINAIIGGILIISAVTGVSIVSGRRLAVAAIQNRGRSV